MTDIPNPIDIAVGARVRLRRDVLSLTQADLAKAIGVSFQQVQKYEKGANRISASRLMQIASHLHTSAATLLGENEPTDAVSPQLMTTPGASELLKAFQAIESRQHRNGLLAMARSLAAPQPD